MTYFHQKQSKKDHYWLPSKSDFIEFDLLIYINAAGMATNAIVLLKFALLEIKLCYWDWDGNLWSFNWDCTWPQDLMKFRFLMSHHRKNSVRDKVIVKKCIYLERNTLHRQSMSHLRWQEQPWNTAWLVFMGWVILYSKEWEEYSNYSGEGVGISRNRTTAHFLAFYGRPRSCHGIFSTPFSCLVTMIRCWG